MKKFDLKRIQRTLGKKHNAASFIVVPDAEYRKSIFDLLFVGQYRKPPSFFGSKRRNLSENRRNSVTFNTRAMKYLLPIMSFITAGHEKENIAVLSICLENVTLMGKFESLVF